MTRIPCEELRVGDVILDPHPDMPEATVIAVRSTSETFGGGATISYRDGAGIQYGSWLRPGYQIEVRRDG